MSQTTELARPSRKRRRTLAVAGPVVAAAATPPPPPAPSPPRPGSHHRSHTDPVPAWKLAAAPPIWQDARGHKRPAATMPGAGKGRAPASKGKTYPPDPPSTVEIVQLLNGCPDTPLGHRLRAIIVLLWRTGMRVGEALALEESDLDATKGSIIIRRAKGGKHRTIGMDPWGWDQFRPWLDERRHYPPGPLFCVRSRVAVKARLSRSGARLGNWNDRRFAGDSRSQHRWPWHPLDRLSSWLYRRLP